MSGPELMLATTALSALRAVEAGRSAAAQSDFAAKAAERDAAAAAQRGAANAEAARRRGSAALATRRARLAHAGTDASGTALDLLGQISGDAAFEALRAADPSNLAAVNQLSRARSLRQRGAAARRAGVLKAGSTLLGGLG